MLFELSASRSPKMSEMRWLQVGVRQVRFWLVPNRRAKRYVLRVRSDGSVRVTIPRGGSFDWALGFVRKQVPWLERQLDRIESHPQLPKRWEIGTTIFLHGELVCLEVAGEGRENAIRIGPESLKVRDVIGDLRPEIERHLWGLAARELAARVAELAAQHGFCVGRVSVRNQRSRWGSCSRRGTLSLNWRLVQAPSFVRDYIITHELAHLTEMNHSPRFWALVERLCPSFLEAERWLKTNGRLLR